MKVVTSFSYICRNLAPLTKRKDKPPSYSDFTLEHLKKMSGIRSMSARLNLPTLPFILPDWLPVPEQLKALKGLPTGTEKAKSEFFIAPVMIAFYQANPNKFKCFSVL